MESDMIEKAEWKKELEEVEQRVEQRFKKELDDRLKPLEDISFVAAEINADVDMIKGFKKELLEDTERLFNTIIEKLEENSQNLSDICKTLKK
tara:strand:- start:288 stop:566 length:279 start_codon:yes stop_codon:yes gene_type:complete